MVRPRNPDPNTRINPGLPRHPMARPAIGFLTSQRRPQRLPLVACNGAAAQAPHGFQPGQQTEDPNRTIPALPGMGLRFLPCPPNKPVVCANEPPNPAPSASHSIDFNNHEPTSSQSSPCPEPQRQAHRVPFQLGAPIQPGAAPPDQHRHRPPAPSPCQQSNQAGPQLGGAARPTLSAARVPQGVS